MARNSSRALVLAPDVWEVQRKPWSWPVLTIGVVLGMVLSVLFVQYAQPLLTGGDNLEPGDLVIMSGRDQSDGEQRKVLIHEWNASHPDNQAKILELPESADKQHSQMVGQAQSEDETVDIYNLDVTWTAEFAKSGYIRPFDRAGLDMSEFLDKPRSTCEYEGELWAMPFNTDAGLLFYNSKDLPKDLVAALPRKWKDVAEEIKIVFAHGRAPKLTAGLTTQLKDYEGLTVTAMEAVWAAGGDVVDDTGSVAIDSEASMAGLRQLIQGVKDSEVNLAESMDYDENLSRGAFHDGHALFMRNWPVAFRLLRPSNEPSELPFNVIPLPGPSVLGGQNLAIAEKTTHPHAAHKLIEFLTSPRSQQILFERGGLAATREIVYFDAAVTQKYPYTKTLLDSIREARTRPITPYYDLFSKRFRGGIRTMLINKSDTLPPGFADQLTEALHGR